MEDLEGKLQSIGATRVFLAILLAAAVGLAAVGLPAVYGGTTTTAQAHASSEPSPYVESYEDISQAELAQEESGLDPADDVYLRDDGSAVLHYQNDSDVNRVEVGMDASEGLMRMLVVDDIENESEELEKANFSAVLDNNGFSSEGSFIMKQPDELDDLEVDVSGQITDETNQFNASASGSFQSEATSTSAAATEGKITATADRLETSGQISVDGATSGTSTEKGTSLAVSLTDTEEGYTADVQQERTVYNWSASQWDTREQAKQTLNQQYGALAADLGGTSEITISNYDFEEQSSGQYRLNIEFTVEYIGIDDGIEQQLTDQLVNDPETDLSQSEAEKIATSVTDLEIETFEFALSENSSSMDAGWNIALANYDELTLAMVDLAEASSTGTETSQSDLENARTAIEAQQAADLEWTLEWDTAAEQTLNQGIQFDAEITSTTENWGAYIDELQANDIETPKNIDFELTANTDGENLSVDAQFDVEAKDLASQSIKSLATSVQSGPTSTTGSSSANEFITALSESELEVARIDANIGNGEVRVEGGAKFENMSKMMDSLSGALPIGGVATEQGDDSVSMYVYVDDMGDIDTESATKSDLEHLSVVNSETTIHEAGKWDKDFPQPASDEIREYLNVENESSDSDGGEQNSGADLPYTNESGIVDEDGFNAAVSDFLSGELKGDYNFNELVSAYLSGEPLE
ncbi:hypothetical protein [Natrinema amylolyticum]|uniref:hypothetical protein n=1 Tax=Natrinema amylolyticum TaxID=2878679 RepID=UPI001CF9732E|nr:hypothetical protein [Natrinema amylolyticum]